MLASHADKLTEDGRQRLVRHGHLPEREVMTGIGPVAVRCPRVRDRVGEGSERIRFSSAILPPYARMRTLKANDEATPRCGRHATKRWSRWLRTRATESVASERRPDPQRRTKCRIKKEAKMPRDLVRTGSLVLALLGATVLSAGKRPATAARR